MSETEGVEHVGAGALGGGTMIIRAKFGDVDDSEDLTVFGFAQPGGRGVRVPAGRGFGRMRVKLLHEGADGLGLGTVGVDIGPPQLPGNEEKQNNARGDKELAGNLDDPLQHGAGSARSIMCLSVAHALSLGLVALRFSAVIRCV